MKYQIDQSIRVEQTNKNTIIGLANGGNDFTVQIAAKIKRIFKENFRRQGQPKKFMVLVFTAGVILAIEKSNLPVKELIIDIEYPGYEGKMITYLKNYFKNKVNVYFSSIGKKSRAHYAAYGAHLKKRKVDYKANYGEIEKIIKKMTESPFGPKVGYTASQGG